MPIKKKKWNSLELLFLCLRLIIVVEKEWVLPIRSMSKNWPKILINRDYWENQMWKTWWKRWDNIEKEKLVKTVKYLAKFESIVNTCHGCYLDDLENLPEAEISAGRWYSSRFNIEPTERKWKYEEFNGIGWFPLFQIEIVRGTYRKNACFATFYIRIWLIVLIEEKFIVVFFIILIKDILLRWISVKKKKKN